MCPRTGRPTLNKKTERFEVRLTKQELELMQECADRLQTTKTEVINKGIQLVKKELDNK